MPDRPRPGARLARRRFLGALALAPAALAGCAAAGSAGSRAAPAAGAPGAAPSSAAPARAAAPDATIGAVREHPLPPDAEPAFVFRAGAARPGEP